MNFENQNFDGTQVESTVEGAQQNQGAVNTIKLGGVEVNLNDPQAAEIIQRQWAALQTGLQAKAQELNALKATQAKPVEQPKVETQQPQAAILPEPVIMMALNNSANAARANAVTRFGEQAVKIIEEQSKDFKDEMVKVLKMKDLNHDFINMYSRHANQFMMAGPVEFKAALSKHLSQGIEQAPVITPEQLAKIDEQKQTPAMPQGNPVSGTVSIDTKAPLTKANLRDRIAQDIKAKAERQRKLDALLDSQK